jgi:hypothetical protein
MLSSSPPRVRASALGITDSFMQKMGYPLQTSTDAYYQGYETFVIMRGSRVYGIVAYTVKDDGLWFHLIASRQRFKDKASWNELHEWLAERRDYYKCKYLVTSINTKNTLALKAAKILGFEELYSFDFETYTFSILGGYDVEAARILRPSDNNNSLNRLGGNPRDRQLSPRH